MANPPVKYPERLAALHERRARQRMEGAVAMTANLKEQVEVKERTRRLREERLAREASLQSILFNTKTPA